MASPRSSPASKSRTDGRSSNQDGQPKGRSSAASSVRSSIQSKIDYANMPPVYKIPLWDLNCQFGMVKKRHSEPTSLRDAVKHQRRIQQANVTIVFATRQPGCASCREHGRQVAELAARDQKVALLATVKETGVNDMGLLKFYETFFNRNPIYLDENWELYHAMGGRTVGVFRLMTRLIAAQGRYWKKKIWHSVGNGKVIKSPWMTGGVLVFDKKGELTYVLEESVGKPFDMDRLEAAIEETRQKSGSSNLGTMDSSEISPTHEETSRRSNIDDTIESSDK